jgi:hypothetical protein
MITAHIASLQERIDTLKLTVDSIVHQVDKVFISLNNYEHIPDFLVRDKVHAEIHDNSLGDAAKFIHVNKVEGYIVVCDDDLIYPEGYVKYMCSKCDLYGGVVSLLGKVYGNRPILSFRRSYTELYRCLGDVDKDSKVDVCGTGAMVYHTEDIKVSVGDFPYRNMADIWMAKLAHNQSVPMYAVAHAKDYVEHVKYQDRIWVNTIDDTVQTEVLNSFLQ